MKKSWGHNANKKYFDINKKINKNKKDTSFIFMAYQLLLVI